jgi:polyhydroxyalkanoate synthesis regulator phasin
MRPASVLSGRTPFQRVGVRRQQELTQTAEGAEALSSEVERLEAELHTANAAADSMVKSVFSCQHIVQLIACWLITLLVEQHVSITISTLLHWLMVCRYLYGDVCCIAQGQTSAEERTTLQQQLEEARKAADEQRQQAELLQGRVAELEAAVSEARSGADAVRKEVS